jgi:ribosomal protein S20
MAISATQVIQRTYSPYRPAVLKRVENKDNKSFDDPTEFHNDFVWALAKKFTNSPEEAEAAVQEMLGDIQRCAEKGIIVKSNEERLIARIAWRRLLKFLQ